MFTFMWIALLVLGTTAVSGQTNYWQKLNGIVAPSEQPMSVRPDSYALYSLQTGRLQDLLSQTGTQFKTGILISLPDPNHTLHSFVVWETPIMEPELAAKFPEMKTYTATSVTDPAVSAKLDLTDDGFRAMVYDGDLTYFIDPYSNSNDGYYLVFYAKDLQGIHQNFSCPITQHPDLLHPDGIPISPYQNRPTMANIRNGATRHQYRLALACTGEYAQLVTNGNPQPAAVLSKIITTVNRINGVYERELSVTFTLVGNEEQLIYLDPATDPYTCNFDLTCLLDENQVNVTQTIGAANYDIGHVLSTAGGGLAALGVVCKDNKKASAASTSSGPDDFSTCLHEMGHQFSALHTFNANTAGCFDNGTPAGAYEPGSGSTIMSYGGLCTPNNIVYTSDDYFHVGSLVQMQHFLTTTGSTCGTPSSGFDLVTIPQSVVKTYHIPQNTPFFLKAPGITPTKEDASILYNWEEYDLGNFGGTEADDGQASSGPVMRSYPPADSGYIRSFPIDKILDGSYTGVGERLPEVARTVRFKLTARSVLHGWGSFATLDSVVKLEVAGQGPFRVDRPSGNITVDPGDTVRVTWEVNHTDQPPVNCQDVNIYLSTDGGQSFPFLLVGSTPNTGEASVVIPDIYTTQGYIKVQGVSNVFYDVGKGRLQINGAKEGIGNITLKEQISLFPNPASGVLYLRYSGSHPEHLTVNMYDVTGRLVKSAEMLRQLSLPVAGLARGMYLVQVINSRTAARAAYTISLQ